MAKDKRVMFTGVEIGGRTYVPGEEDELEEAMTPKQLAHLEKQGALEGPWEARIRDSGDASRTEGDQESSKSISRMNQAELKALAQEKGVEIPEGATNAEIRDALKAAAVED